MLIFMLASDARAEEITVWGSSVSPPEPLREADGAVTVLSGERLREPGLRAPLVLRGLPGVQVVDTGLLATVQVRGAGSNQVPVYFAGMRINDDVGGTADLSLVPMGLVDRVEVYRGSSPERADRVALGGALFFEPRRARKRVVVSEAEGGSFGHRVVRAHASPVTGWLVFAEEARVSNDFLYTDDRGTRFSKADDMRALRKNADQRTRTYWATASHEMGRVHLRAIAGHIEREAGVPGLAPLPATRARVDQMRTLGGLTVNVQFASAELDMRSGAIASSSVYVDPARELGLLATRTAQTGARVEHEVGALFALSERTDLRVRTTGAHETLSMESTGAPARDARRVFSRAAVSLDERVHRLVRGRVFAAVECHGTSTAGISLCDTRLTMPRASVRIGEPHEHVEATIGQAARQATLGELFGVSGVVRGNAALRPETGHIVEVGTRRTTESLHVEAWAYARWVDDLIVYQQTAIGYIRPYNALKTRSLGAEFVMRLVPAPLWRLEMAASWLDARDTTPNRALKNDILPYRSRLVVDPRVQWSVPLGVGHAAFEVRYLHQSARFADSAGLVRLPAQGSLDASASFVTVPSTLRVRVANLLNQTQFDLIGYPLPTRAIYSSIEVRH